MTLQTIDQASIKLHTDHNDVVWFADGDRNPVSSGVSAADFVETLRNRKNLRLRLLGSHINAKLIMRLRQLVNERDSFIEIASPLVCASIAERLDPDIVLFRLRQCCLPASTGGWHRLTNLDYATFSLIAQIQSDGQFLNTSYQLLYNHPLWKPLTFIRGISADWTAWLIHVIIDPRWYVDPLRPGRLSRLRSYLGLRPDIQAAVMARDPIHRKNHFVAKCKMVYGTWAAYGEPPEEDMELPGNFLWRAARSAGGGIRGGLRGSQRFISFLVYAWQQAIHDASKPLRGSELMFMPELLFKTEEEIEAFRAHMR